MLKYGDFILESKLTCSNFKIFCNIEEEFPEVLQSQKKYDHFIEGLTLFVGDFCALWPESEFKKLVENYGYKHPSTKKSISNLSKHQIYLNE